MHPLDLIAPWIVFAVILFPLLALERWIHRHLYGIGWLLTKDKERATVLYYLILLPGVFVHEFTQWLAAGALNVRTRQITAWPEAQDSGALRLNFVRLEKTDTFRAALIGAAPLVAGVLIVLFISQNIFDVRQIAEAFSAGELPAILAQLQRLFATPDFWLWLYLLFAVGNAMIPTPADRQGWPFLLGIFGAIAVFLLIIGLGEEVILPFLQGPITRALDVLVTAFASVLALDVFVVIGLGVFEQVLSQAKKDRFPYQKSKPRTAPKPVPGSESPLPPEFAPLRITERRLPLPPPPKRQSARKAAASLASPAAQPILGTPVREVKSPEEIPYRPAAEEKAEAPSRILIRRRMPDEESEFEEQPEPLDEAADMPGTSPEDGGREEIEIAEEPEARDTFKSGVRVRERSEEADKEDVDNDEDGELRYEPYEDSP